MSSFGDMIICISLKQPNRAARKIVNVWSIKIKSKRVGSEAREEKRSFPFLPTVFRDTCATWNLNRGCISYANALANDNVTENSLYAVRLAQAHVKINLTRCWCVVILLVCVIFSFEMKIKLDLACGKIRAKWMSKNIIVSCVWMILKATSHFSSLKPSPSSTLISRTIER